MQFNSLKNSIYLLLNTSLMLLAIIIWSTNFISSFIAFVIIILSLAISYNFKSRDVIYVKLIKMAKYFLAYAIFTTLISYSILYVPDLADAKQVPCLITCNKQFECKVLQCEIKDMDLTNAVDIEFLEVLILSFIKTTLLLVLSIVNIYYIALTFIYFIFAIRKCLNSKLVKV
jgi:hypothetical protein